MKSTTPTTAIPLMNLSLKPVEDLNTLAYEGQPQKLRNYVPGYERLFENMPVLNKEIIKDVPEETLLEYVRKAHPACLGNSSGWMQNSGPVQQQYVKKRAYPIKTAVKTGH